MTANLSEPTLEKVHRDFLAYQRQEMLGTLSGIIAHEYNNLMTPVVMRAQDALARGDVGAMKKALAVTEHQTNMALAFTREVIQMAQGQETAARACRASELIDSAVAASVRPLEKDAIELVVDVPEDLKIHARPRLFVQALLNLILNARKSMEGRRGKMSITATRAGDRVVFAVKDRGVGLPRDVLDNELTPFFNAEPNGCQPEHKTAGLGMQACRMIAWDHGATISAQNNNGPGCTFFMNWPAA